MKNLKNTSLALLSTLIMSTQSSVAEVLTDTQLHATLGIVTHFILDDSSISHNGTTYGEVTSPYTGRVWLDRNLGASKVCTALDDTACYGGYYQWGRAHDGHQVSNSFDYPTLANNVTTVGHADFITNSISPYDWASVDANGAIRFDNWIANDGSSICPVGFRVPTIAELNAELLDVGSAEVTNNTDAFNSFLKIPSAGAHDNNGGMVNEGSRGLLWAVSVNGNYSYNIYFRSNIASLGTSGFRAYGRSVRCIKSQTHTHNGTTYGEVVSPYTGKVWLDRNLGANRVCTSLDDTECYGDYYQWGRNADGHQVSTSNTTSSLASSITNVGHGDFIINGSLPSDWALLDLAGAGRTASWSATDGSSVCPTGFRVPTIVELEAELFDVGSAEIANNTDAFNSFLVLPSAGGRSNTSASLFNQSSFSYTWASSVSSSSSHFVFFGSVSAGWGQYRHSVGYSVRCLRD